MKEVLLFSLLLATPCCFSSAFQLSSRNRGDKNLYTYSTRWSQGDDIDARADDDVLGRRDLFQKSISALTLSSALLAAGSPAMAVTPTGAGDGLIGDLPPEAQRSYLQYRIPLQTFADFYIFEFQRLVGQTDDWGEVGQLFNVQNSRGGQGQPSRIEREFTNPIRILRYVPLS